MVLVHAMKNGRSNIPEANFVCKMLFALCLQGYHVTTKLEHVPTDVNPADIDDPSRLSLSQAAPFFVSPMFAHCGSDATDVAVGPTFQNLIF